jgi:hypothetical protein
MILLMGRLSRIIPNTILMHKRQNKEKRKQLNVGPAEAKRRESKEKEVDFQCTYAEPTEQRK